MTYPSPLCETKKEIRESSPNAPKAKTLLSELLSSHGLAHRAEVKEWAQIRALVEHNFVLVICFRVLTQHTPSSMGFGYCDLFQRVIAFVINLEMFVTAGYCVFRVYSS